MGCRQVVRQGTLTPSSRRFESRQPNQIEKVTRKCGFLYFIRWDSKMNSKSASEAKHDWEKQSSGLFRSWLDESRQPNQIEKVTRKCGFLFFIWWDSKMNSKSASKAKHDWEKQSSGKADEHCRWQMKRGGL